MLCDYDVCMITRIFVHNSMPVCRAAEMGCSHLAAFHKVKKHLSKVKVENKKKVKKKNKRSDIEKQIGRLLSCRRIVLLSY